MDTFDYRANAIQRAGGPESEVAVVAVAESMHLNDSLHPHGLEAQPCSDCWLRAGNAIQALHDAGFSLVAQIGEIS